MSNGSTEPPDGMEVIKQLITSPRRVSADGIDASARSAQEIILLDRHVRSSGSIRAGFRGMTIQTAVPPNALGFHSGVYRGAR